MNKKGYALMTVIFFLLIFAGLVLFFVNIFFSESRTVSTEYSYSKAFNIAEAGRVYAVKRMAGVSNWSAPGIFPMTKTFGGGQFTVNLAGSGPTWATLESTGIVTSEGKTYRRKIQARVMITGGLALGDFAVFSWGVGSGTGDHTVNISNNASIVGNIFTASNVVLGNNSSITGSVFSSGSVSTGSGVTVTGTTAAYVSTPAAPSLDTSYYQSLINTAATYPTGNLSIANGQTVAFSGTTYVNGNFLTGNNVTLTVTGTQATVVVNGSATFGNDNIVGNNFRLIVKNNITFGNNLTWGTDGLIFALLPTSVITFGNNGETGNAGVGNGTVVLTPGTVILNNNCEFYGLIYAETRAVINNNVELSGSLISGFIDSIGNNSTLTLSSGAVDYSGITGLSMGLGLGGTITTGDWREVF